MDDRKSVEIFICDIRNSLSIFTDYRLFIDCELQPTYKVVTIMEDAIFTLRKTVKPHDSLIHEKRTIDLIPRDKLTPY